MLYVYEYGEDIRGAFIQKGGVPNDTFVRHFEAVRALKYDDLDEYVSNVIEKDVFVTDILSPFVTAIMCGKESEDDEYVAELQDEMQALLKKGKGSMYIDGEQCAIGIGYSKKKAKSAALRGWAQTDDDW